MLFEDMKVHIYLDKGAHVTYSGERVWEAVAPHKFEWKHTVSWNVASSLAAKTSDKHSL